METYEIRLLKRDGSVTMVYLTSCEMDVEAVACLKGTEDIAYDLYEIWNDRRLVAQGAKPAA